MTKAEKIRRRKIKSLMALRGITGADIARKLSVSHITVSVVLGGHGTSKRIRKGIADAIGLNVNDLWPEKNGKGEAA